MNFRISVESVVYTDPGLNAKVLLVKRAPNCKVAPGVWNVPAGKVDMLETTATAVVRETYEETKLRVEIVKFLSEQAFEIKVGNEPTYRNMFTYLTRSVDSSQEVELDREHTEFAWVTKEMLELEQFSSLMPRLKTILLEVFHEYST